MLHLEFGIKLSWGGNFFYLDYIVWIFFVGVWLEGGNCFLTPTEKIEAVCFSERFLHTLL